MKKEVQIEYDIYEILVDVTHSWGDRITPESYDYKILGVLESDENGIQQTSSESKFGGNDMEAIFQLAIDKFKDN